MEKVYEIFANGKRVCKNEQYQKQIDGTYKKLPSAYRFKTRERAIEIAKRNNAEGYNIVETDKVPIEKVIEYCEEHIPCFNYYNKIVDMEYDNDKLLVGNWWKRDDHNNLYIHPICDFIEDNYDNVETDFDDEWASCSRCNGAVRTIPTSYSWEPSYITTECEILCHECCNENTEELIEHFKNNPNNAIPSWAIVIVEEAGFVCLEDNEMVCSRFQSGFHQGMSDTPESVIKEIEEEFNLDSIEEMFDYVFVITDHSQFNIDFTIFLRKIEEE